MALTYHDQDEVNSFKEFLELCKNNDKNGAYQKVYSSPKQIIVMRTDLNMRKGKMAAQASHASMAVILNMMESEYNELYERRHLTIPNGSALDAWLNGPFKKICVGIDSEQALNDLFDRVQAANIPVSKIIDSGLTEFGGEKTLTCIAIGPDYPENIDPFTKDLKLL